MLTGCVVWGRELKSAAGVCQEQQMSQGMAGCTMSNRVYHEQQSEYPAHRGLLTGPPHWAHGPKVHWASVP